MATQACVFNICFPVPSGLGGLIPGATTSSSPAAAPTTTAAANSPTTAAANPGTAASPTTNNAVAATTIPATTIISAGQTITAPASTITAAAAGGVTITQTLIRTVTAAGAAGGAAGGGLGATSVGANGLPAIPSGLVLPDNFKLPPGFQLPPKPKYDFDRDARLSDAVLYAILLFPTLYLMVKHGGRGLLIWPIMAAFCIVRIAADALFMWPGGSLLKIGTGWIVTGAMALILLVMFPAGLNFEAGAYIPTSSRVKRFLIFAGTVFVFTLGLILGTIGSVPLSLIAQIRNKPYNLKMARAGYILILIFLIFTWLHSIILYIKSSRSITPLSQRKRVRALLLGSILSIPFIAVRVGRGIHYSFTYAPTLNPINGSFLTIFVFVWLMQLLAFLIILISGFVALRIKHAGRRTSRHHSGTTVVSDRDLDSDDLDDVKAEEHRAAAVAAAGGAGATAATHGGPRRHRFARRKHNHHHHDTAMTEPGVAEDGYYVPEKQRDVREV